MFGSGSRLGSTYPASFLPPESMGRKEEDPPLEGCAGGLQSHFVAQCTVGGNNRKKMIITARRKKSYIPDEKKDCCYWDKRIKNNEAARRSREKRRLDDLMTAGRLAAITEENARLRTDLITAKIQCEILKNTSPFPLLYYSSRPPVVTNIWRYRMWPRMRPSALSAPSDPACIGNHNHFQNHLVRPISPKDEAVWYTHQAAARGQSATSWCASKVNNALLYSAMETAFCDGHSITAVSAKELPDSLMTHTKKLPYNVQSKHSVSREAEIVSKDHCCPTAAPESSVNDICSHRLTFAPFQPSKPSAFSSLPIDIGQGLSTNEEKPWHDIPSLSTTAFPDATLCYPETRANYQNSALCIGNSFLQPNQAYI